MTDTTPETNHEAASQRWISIRNRAGYHTNLALERALDIAPGGIWNWIAREREPVLPTLRRLREMLGISMDELDQLIQDMRKEHAARNQSPSSA